MPTHPTCGSYGSGHRIHWIQARKSSEPGQPVIAVKVVAVHDDGRIELQGRDLAVTLWHHDAAVLPRPGAAAEWRPRFHVLACFGGGLLNLADPARAEPCVPPIRHRPNETVRQYIERAMRDNHGYVVPGHWLTDLDAVPDGDAGEPQTGYLVGVDDPAPEDKALLHKLSEEIGHEPR